VADAPLSYQGRKTKAACPVGDCSMKRRLARLALQAGFSLMVFGALFHVASGEKVLAGFRSLNPRALILAAALQASAIVLNSFRWQQLLGRAGIRERLSQLTELYLVGQFFSLLLPSSAGGDAVRVYAVARRHPAEATPAILLATLQERVLGLATTLALGVVATAYFLPILPGRVAIAALLVESGAAAGVLIVLFPEPVFALADRTRAISSRWPVLRRPGLQRLVVRIESVVSPLRGLARFSIARLFSLLVLASPVILIGVAIHYVLGRSLGVTANLPAYCLVVPLVWLVRVLPISLNGMGVGEGAFVVLMGLFGVPAELSLPLSLGVFGLQTALALPGGLFLLTRSVQGTWNPDRDRESPEDKSREACVSEQAGDRCQSSAA
jgi:glycosyltransferase 2 family protein